MTEARMLKLVGKKVRIKKHIFPHSVDIELIEGVILEAEEVETHLLRDNIFKHYKHNDFYIEVDDGVLKCIQWNEIKLIISCEVLKDE